MFDRHDVERIVMYLLVLALTGCLLFVMFKYSYAADDCNKHWEEEVRAMIDSNVCLQQQQEVFNSTLLNDVLGGFDNAYKGYNKTS